MRNAGSALIVMFYLLVPRASFPCDCVPHDFPIRKDIANSVKAADLVFSGIVESIYLYDPQNIPGVRPQSILVAEFKVFEVFKGLIRGKFYISTGSGAARRKGPSDCGYPFRTGEKYLVYAYGGKYTFPYTDYCSRTSLLEYAEADLRFLKGKPAAPEDLLQEDTYIKHFDQRFSGKICGKITSVSVKPDTAKNYWLFLWSLKDGRWNWPYWIVGNVSDDGNFCTVGLEPGKYRIGASRGNWDQERAHGFYATADRMEESSIIDLKLHAQLNGINFTVRRNSQLTVKGKIRLSGSSKMPPGKLIVQATNDWDFNLHAYALVSKDGSFAIQNLYPGEVRLTLAFTPEKSVDAGAWWARIPEVQIPEQAQNVLIDLRRETLADSLARAFDVTYEYLQRQFGKPRKMSNHF